MMRLMNYRLPGFTGGAGGRQVFLTKYRYYVFDGKAMASLRTIFLQGMH